MTSASRRRGCWSSTPTTGRARASSGSSGSATGSRSWAARATPRRPSPSSASSHPDVVILDPRLPELDRRHLAHPRDPRRRARRPHPRARLVAGARAARLVAAGADGVPPQDLQARRARRSPSSAASTTASTTLAAARRIASRGGHDPLGRRLPMRISRPRDRPPRRPASRRPDPGRTPRRASACCSSTTMPSSGWACAPSSTCCDDIEVVGEAVRRRGGRGDGPPARARTSS